MPIPPLPVCRSLAVFDPPPGVPFTLAQPAAAGGPCAVVFRSLDNNGKTTSITIVGYVAPGTSLTFTPPMAPAGVNQPVSGLCAVVDVPPVETQPIDPYAVAAAVANTIQDADSPWGVPWQ
jgi:hypothetical protein